MPGNYEYVPTQVLTEYFRSRLRDSQTAGEQPPHYPEH